MIEPNNETISKPSSHHQNQGNDKVDGETKKEVIAQLVSYLGKKNVSTQSSRLSYYTKGWRTGKGNALAVVFPQSPLQFWQALTVCVKSHCIIIVQAANTGLTEGSTPNGNDYDRPVVVINILALDKLYLLNDGMQVLSLAGVRLHALEQALKPHKRAPHSVIGSSSLGATVVGGIANNSGGALVKRGPAYTELALYAQVNAKGQLILVNHLGIELGSTPEQILTNLASGNFETNNIETSFAASASDYEKKLREVTANSASRYNADPSKHFEASGCAGKLAVFAVRVDTFELPKKEVTFYIGSNSQKALSDMRYHILTQFNYLPDVGEYMHRDCYEVSRKYGKDIFLSVLHLGTKALPRFFALKGKFDAWWLRRKLTPIHISDKLLQILSCLFPSQIPSRIKHFSEQYEHCLILKTSDAGIVETRDFLNKYFAASNSNIEAERGAFFECTANEAKRAFLNRFAAAGAAIRYFIMHQKYSEDILSLDIALSRNNPNWVEILPEHISTQIERRFYYGHFFCYVFHHDYIVKKGVDVAKLKSQILLWLDEQNSKYPAEHNVGHVYEAEPQLKAFYEKLDPTNTFNPGIGKTSKRSRRCQCC